MLAVSASTSALADARCAGDCVAVGQWNFSLGLGYGIRSNPVIGQDDVEYIVVPKFSYYGKRFFIDTYDLGYTLLDAERHQINAILFTPGFEQIFFNNNSILRYSVDHKTVSAAPDSGQPSDNDYTEVNIELHKRRIAALSGFEYTYMARYFDWQTQLMQDVSNIHNGQKIRTALTWPWQNHNQQLLLSIGLTWQSQKLVDYYYGIHANDTPNPELYHTASASTAVHVSAEWERYFSKHWSIRGVANYRWLGDGVRNSPLVEDDAVSTLFMAGVYHF